MKDTNNNIWIKFYARHDFYIRKDFIIGIRREWKFSKAIYFLLLSNGKEIEIDEYYIRESKLFEALEIKE